MKMLFDGGLWLFPIYAFLFLLIVGIVLCLDPIMCYFSRRKYRRSLEAARRYRSF